MTDQILTSLELQIKDLDIQITELNKLRNTLFIKYCNIIDIEGEK